MIKEAVRVVEIKEFDKSLYEFREDGIIVISIKDGSHMELEDMLKEHRFVLSKQEYLPMRVLVKPGKNTSISKEVREYVNRPDAKKLVYCQAILVDNLAHKIIADFMMRLYRTPGAFKVFSDEDRAIEWVKNYQQKT